MGTPRDAATRPSRLGPKGRRFKSDRPDALDEACTGYDRAVKLYVCWGTWRSPTPLVGGGNPHPCGRAHEALQEAGHDPDVVRSYGWRVLPGVFNMTSGRRKVKELTGQLEVPVLVTDDEEVIVGTCEIVAWAASNPA